MNLNKICSVIFRFFYKLLRIYQFTTDQFYTKKHKQASPVKKCTKIYNIFYLRHGSTYVELNKIYFIFLDFSMNYYVFINFQP